MKIVAAKTGGGGGYFKPKDETDKDFFLLEVLEYEPQRETAYGPKDTVYANAVAFKDGKADDRGRTSFSNAGLVGPLKDIVGEHTVVVLGQYTNKKGQEVWCWNQPEDEMIQTAVKWGEEKEAKEAADAADAPTF